MVDDGERARAIEAARGYERLLVPALFAEWAPRVADAAEVRPGRRALDIACGTGVLARELARRGAHVTGLDASSGMLAVAAELAPSIAWREGSAEALPFADASFDAVVSQFGLMLFRDRVAALREMRRVARPAAPIVVAVWDRAERIPAYAAWVDLLDRELGRAAGDALRAVFAFEREELERLLDQAELAPATVTTERGTASFPGVRALAEADLRGWLPAMGVTPSDEEVARVLRAADEALGTYVQPDGALRFEMRAHVGVARAV